MRRWESSASEKWLKINAHSSLDSVLRQLQAEGVTQILAVVPGMDGDDNGSSPDAGKAMLSAGPSLAEADFGSATALLYCEHVTDQMREALSGAANGNIAMLRLDLADEVLPLSVLAAITLHYGRTARARALGALVNQWGGDLHEGAVHELYADYVQRGRGFRRGRRIQGSMRTAVTGRDAASPQPQPFDGEPRRFVS